jgi:cytochrome c oxidase subunit 2
VPVAASAHAADIDFVLMLVHGLMLVLFVGWTAYFAFVLIRFRSGRQTHANPEGATGRLAFFVEIGIVLAEGVLLIVFALPLWFTRTSSPPTTADIVTVRIVAQQFQWNVHYAGADGLFGTTSLPLISPENPIGLDRRSAGGKDDGVDLNVIHLPVNRPAVIQLSSLDVIHSFGVPAMRVKQDVIPGLFTPVWFTPTRIGRYDIQCSQLCGLGHYRMHGILQVETEAEYQAYLASLAPPK